MAVWRLGFHNELDFLSQNERGRGKRVRREGEMWTSTGVLILVRGRKVEGGMAAVTVVLLAGEKKKRKKRRFFK